MNKAKELSERITEYMSNGGLVNSEFMDHEAVRDLLFDCREVFLVALHTDSSMQITGGTSDGFHTFDELYDFRKAYNAALFNEWALSSKYSVHKSKRHYDGEYCFGGDWFIVAAQLPEGLISNHYELKDWDLFQLPETDKALFEYDNHTAADVLRRLFSLQPLAQPKQEPIAWVSGYKDGNCVVVPIDGNTIFPTGLALFIASTKREWVDLPDEDIVLSYTKVSNKEWAIAGLTDARVFAQSIEAKLKEKNHG